jgi:hypothetical protein
MWGGGVFFFPVGPGALLLLLRLLPPGGMSNGATCSVTHVVVVLLATSALRSCVYVLVLVARGSWLDTHGFYRDRGPGRGILLGIEWHGSAPSAQEGGPLFYSRLILEYLEGCEADFRLHQKKLSALLNHG